MSPRFGKIIYTRYMGELWLWMIFLEWIYYSIKKWHFQNEKEFLDRWTGVSLLLGEEKSKRSFFAAFAQMKSLLATLFIVGLTLFLFISYKNFTWLYSTILLLNLVGLNLICHENTSQNCTGNNHFHVLNGSSLGSIIDRNNLSKKWNRNERIHNRMGS